MSGKSESAGTLECPLRIPGFKILNPLPDRPGHRPHRFNRLRVEESTGGRGAALRSGSASMAVYKNIALRQLGDRQLAFPGHWAPVEHASLKAEWAIIFLHTDANSWMM